MFVSAEARNLCDHPQTNGVAKNYSSPVRMIILLLLRKM
jgi:hypothetical protein